ncbi:GDSL family lipase [Francisella sp. Scap27]|uniref:SGNH/GDSL hydrolase family protein n=1 Tax=Francisella sp. Scap27 TaxID=2589986 RepID=UPI0015BDBB67|nr:SGNH/GDSL hydrolase family protein [Francisella sp. Scap27]QLE78450.1 GDSL family lipase [Francisella sp. Scap27]
MKRNYFIIMISGLFLIKFSFADARSQIILENNCPSPVSFDINPGNSTGAKIINKILAPNEYVNIGSYTNDNIVDYISLIDISYHSMQTQDSGYVQYILNNGWEANHASFEKLQNIAVEHLNDTFSYDWHSYTTTLKYRIPIFTVSACQEQINLENSKLKDVERILIFGDSLSDNGNLYGYTNGIIPKSLPYNKGMFSNGVVWSDYLAKLVKNKIAVSNYSVGGATAIFEPEWTDLGLPYTLGTELTAYNLDSGAHDTNKKLAIFFIGANDYLTIAADQDPNSIPNIANQVTNRIISVIKEVNAAKTLIIGLPNLALTPESAEIGNQHLLQKISFLHNGLLKQFSETDDNIEFISLNDMFDMLVNNTSKFNEVYKTSLNPNKISQSCWIGGYFIPQDYKSSDFYKDLLVADPEIKAVYEENNFKTEDIDMNKIPLTPDITSAILAAETGTLCDNPQEFIFWDKVHPTYQIQKALFEYITKKLGLKIK